MTVTISTLAVSPREATGKGAARSLRRNGEIPAIIYGDGKEEIRVSANLNDTRKVISRGNFKSRLIELDLGKEKIQALPRDVQLHPVTDVPEHVDFLRVNAKSEVRIMVRIEFKNVENAPGIKRGGVLNIVRRKIEMICRADAIPELLTFDLAGAQIGDTVHFSQLEIPEGVRPVIVDRDFTIATLVGRVLKAETSTEEEGEGEGENTDEENSEETTEENSGE